MKQDPEEDSDDERCAWQSLLWCSIAFVVSVLILKFCAGPYSAIWVGLVIWGLFLRRL